MTTKEKLVLKKAVDDPRGLFSPADMINGFAGHDQRSVENLVTGGYLEEVPQDHPGLNGGFYSLNFYRVTEKGRIIFAPSYKRYWFNFKDQTALYVGVASIIFGLLSAVISFYAVKSSIKEVSLVAMVNRPYIEIIPTERADLVKIMTGENNRPALTLGVTIENIGNVPAKLDRWDNVSIKLSSGSGIIVDNATTTKEAVINKEYTIIYPSEKKTLYLPIKYLQDQDLSQCSIFLQSKLNIDAELRLIYYDVGDTEKQALHFVKKRTIVDDQAGTAYTKYTDAN